MPSIETTLSRRAWPHSAAAIERTMFDLTDEQRAKVLGLNAARFWNIEVPANHQLVGKQG
jgi:hypothetical protein